MVKRSLRADCRGQVIVVTGLLVALLLLSTSIYVINVQKGTPTVDSHVDDIFRGYRETTRSTLISALANVSGGGSNNILLSDLAKLKQTISAHTYQSLLTLDCTLIDTAPYNHGLWLFWGSNGVGISSTSVDFVFTSNNAVSSSSTAYSLNVSSQVHISGVYTAELNDSAMVNLDVNVYNEGIPALAQSLTFNYLNGSDWVPVDSPVIVDNGDGSYDVSFQVQTDPLNFPLQISTLAIDKRGISVGANLTCNSTIDMPDAMDPCSEAITTSTEFSIIRFSNWLNSDALLSDYDDSTICSTSSDDLSSSIESNDSQVYLDENNTQLNDYTQVQLSAPSYNGGFIASVQSQSYLNINCSNLVPANSSVSVDTNNGSSTSSLQPQNSLSFTLPFCSALTMDPQSISVGMNLNMQSCDVIVAVESGVPV